ncbi:MAG: nucleotidyl transferase AbiEii/AbiGii toxin family protein [Vicinamibacterales bacterium]
MKRSGPRNVVASVQARLVERSRELGVEHQLTLARFAGERLLYRLSTSEFADRFILKGAALLLLWLGEPIRPTKDVDLLSFGDTSADALGRVFGVLCAIEAADDGLTFLPDSIQVEPIREEQEYGGMRVKLMAMLGNVRIPLQVDVGAGDAVVPPPEIREFPGLLDLPRATLRMYRPETSIAEKTEALVRLGLANSRMKDFFDIHELAATHAFDGDILRRAVAATFARRGTAIPAERPLALTAEFAGNPQKQAQWAPFVRRTRRPELGELPRIIDALDAFLWPVLEAAARGDGWPYLWSNGGPWEAR